MISTREAYGKALAKLGEDYEFIVLDADLSKATKTVDFAKKFPERFVNVGIAESNMMGYAAGISNYNVPVFASTFAAFAAGRAYDQVRNTICYSNSNVKIGATHAGVLIGADGGSHQCIEDIALMRAIPGMTVLAPCDEISTYECVKAAIEYKGPVYLRFGRFGSPKVYETGTFEIGKSNILSDGSDVTIIAFGDMVSKALNVSKILSKENITVRVVDMYSIKPIDKEVIIDSARKTGCIVTAEDHNILGGLGGAVCEVLSNNLPTIVEQVGIKDSFGRSGSQEDLAVYYGLDEDYIIKSVRKAIKRKEN